MDYIAHIRQKDGCIQSVREHLDGVKTGCEQFGEKIGARHLAGLAGWLHDLGKNTKGFLKYIQEAAANPDAPPRRGSIDHSTAGGRLLYRRYHQKAKTVEDKLAAEWIANCIISHHQGLRDFLDPQLNSPFIERVAMKELEEYERTESAFFEMYAEKELDQNFAKAKSEVKHFLHVIQNQKLPSITVSLLIKYIFSCLIDADRTDSRQFEEEEKSEEVFDSKAFFTQSYEKLMSRIMDLEQGDDADHPINRLRSEMSRQCEEFARRPSGIYTLSIPTGGGKTLASLRYALAHAKRWGKERIIFIVPYTTIIEQNASEIRGILDDHGMILEHHSNVIEEYDLDDDNDYIRKKKIRLARDNWDRPIIFTTMVQFLNTFYAKGTRNIRRMHRMTNAVLIFDEVQSVPAKCISLFNAALNFLHIFGRSSLVLCTATQPALDFVKHKLRLSEQGEMIANLDEVSRSFKRVEIVDRTTPLGWRTEELAAFIQERLEEAPRILVILNTKAAVRKLFVQLEQSDWVEENGVRLFHLSTNMCPAHRKDVLTEVKQALSNNERVICVSTQLIEAGVNISFDCVIRSLAGLDSIAQAAGRCNRHGKDAVRNVYVIKSADEVLTRLPEIRIGAEKTERLLFEIQKEPERFGHDLLSGAALNTYFQYYYAHIKDELHYPIKELEKNLFDLLGTNRDYHAAYERKHGSIPETLTRASFATAEKHFEVIANGATSVLVPYNTDAENIILTLNGELDSRELGELLQKSQQYVVNLYQHELKKLEKNGDIYPLLHGHVLALREVAYSDRFGVETEGEGEWTMALI
ncbi:CRISPR-associated helicase Cas3' [Brevibacillus composti]|uniref:CRISPR-associated helicase Cas3 n=1 Tax=Brevibacillus composti TaxID=2796470 RepID=A0A7T5ENP8_9BACL|nr:CRISPR-associated helicase Cas3' [Brevibacillus composti]QQE75937.1 CRISPR-associated helicase Cas3' [Brevibacillus composti]QUO42963.1 CRISPR-associated helicase Cas3' [Brevibacillus composti]